MRYHLELWAQLFGRLGIRFLDNIIYHTDIWLLLLLLQLLDLELLVEPPPTSSSTSGRTTKSPSASANNRASAPFLLVLLTAEGSLELDMTGPVSSSCMLMLRRRLVGCLDTGREFRVVSVPSVIMTLEVSRLST